MTDWTDDVRLRLAPLKLNPVREAQIIEELSQHLGQRYENLVGGGINADAARRLAIDELLTAAALEELARSVPRLRLPAPIVPGEPARSPLRDLRLDLRYAVRRLWTQPGFTAAALLTLALGLGANIAIFSLIYSLLIRALPVERPDELYRLGDTTNCCVNTGLQDSYSLYSTRLFEHLREATRGDFVELAGFQANTHPVALRYGSRVAASVQAKYVSANYFHMFGVRPEAGRLFEPDDDRTDAQPVVVISDLAWSQHFGRDPSIIGSTVLVAGSPMTVAGVAARGFFGDTVRPDPPGVWLPLGQELAQRGEAAIAHRVNQDWLYAIGRIRHGVSVERATARATAALVQWLDAQSFLSKEERREIPRQQIKVVSAGGGVPLLQAQFGQVLTVLFATSALVLLIATANLANLLLARADRGQAAIRVALGASAARLVRQAMTEGILLSLVGGAFAVGVAVLAARALVRLAFPDASYVPVGTASAPMVWVFTIGLASLTGALFSAMPAWIMARTPPLDALAATGRSGHVRSFIPRRSLVVIQVALSFVLLIGAGLMARSLSNLESQPLGFDPESRVIARIIPPPQLAGQHDRLIQTYDAIRDRLLQIPGVRDATFALYTPMQGENWSSGLRIAGREAAPGTPEVTSWNRIGPRYFETIGTRLLRGRLMTESETKGGAPVAIISETFRRRFLPNTNPLGQRLGIGGPERSSDYEVIGVVEDVRYTDPRGPVRPMLFLPAFYTPRTGDPGFANILTRSMLMRMFVLRARDDAATLEPAVRRIIAETAPEMQVIRVHPLVSQVSTSYRVERLMARLTSMYGLLALLVASVGLYGVTAFTVAQRSREIGVRMALGADRSRILGTVVRGPLGQTLIGLLIGVPCAYVASRSIATQLYGVDRGDPFIFIAAIAALCVSTGIAALIPALRATAIDPTQALRE